MAADITDKARKSYSLLTKSLSAGISDVDTTIPFNNVTNIPTDTAVDFIIDRVDSNGTPTPTLRELCKGVVSGANLINCVRGVHGTTAQSHLSGAVVEFIVSASAHNDLIDLILVDHSQSGTHEIATNYDPANPTLETQKWVGVSSAVNELTVTNATTGNFPTISATGEADTGIDFENSEGEEILKLDAVASAVNEVTINNAATTGSPKLAASGGDTNIDLQLAGKGDTGSPRFYGNYDGWNLDADTWTYASATTFTIAGKDVTARFPVGTKLKLTQTTAKYFYVVSSAFSTNTTITVTGGSDYSLTNAAITLPHYSYESSPQAFPNRFAWSPTWGNLTVGNGTVTAYFSINSKVVTLDVYLLYGSTSSISGNVNITLPFTAIALPSNVETLIGTGHIEDNGTTNMMATVRRTDTTTAVIEVAGSSATYVTPTAASMNSTTPMTWTTNDSLHFMATYLAA